MAKATQEDSNIGAKEGGEGELELWIELFAGEGKEGKETMEMAARKTNFAVTCSLLSQYIKEKGGVAELGLGVRPRPQEDGQGKLEAFRPPTTMQLLPGADVSSGDEDERETAVELFPQRVEKPEDAARESENSQLTIFYGGKVAVFDNFPAVKAQDLLQLASRGNSTARWFDLESPSCSLTSLSDQNSALVPRSPTTLLNTQGRLSSSVHPSLSDLPIARKASLQRFFEKRKDRINERAPYQKVNASKEVTPVKQENRSRSWLGLGPQFSFPSLS